MKRGIGTADEDIAREFFRLDSDAAPHDSITKALDAVRRHLGMEIAFISEFVGHERILQYVSARNDNAPIYVGQRVPLTSGYCKKIVDGELPQLIPDTSRMPEAMAMPDTRLFPIGSHMSVPIKLSDGSLYGTFCCLSSHPDPSLNERDLDVMKMVSELVTSQIEGSVEETRRINRMIETISKAIVASEPSMVFQPIVDLETRRIVGAEALSRFSGVPYRTPDRWFDDAGHVGMRSELETVAIRNAITGYAPVWAVDPYCDLAINASASTVMDSDFEEALQGAPLRRIIIEITEHDQVADYAALERALEPLRARGVRVAVDDAGSGYASLRHILRIRPDLIKLDISLIRDIDTDPMRQALASAVVQFAARTGCRVLAEGIETDAELTFVASIGVSLGQGFFLGKPAKFDVLMAAIRD